MAEVAALLSDAFRAYSRGDLASAEKLCCSAIELSPKHVEAIVLLGIVLARSGNRDAAISRLREAIDLDPRNFEAHVALSTLLFAAGQSDEAVLHGERAISLQPSEPGSYHHLAKDLIAHGSTERAIPYLRRALKVAPFSASLLQDLATALTETGQLKEALEFWVKLTRFHPRFLNGWIKLGGMYLASRRNKEAVDCGRKAVSLEPTSADAQLLMGLASLAEGGALEAKAHLGEALKLQPNEMVANSAYGLALHEMGQFHEARPYFERALEIRPSHGQSYYSIVRTEKTMEADRPLLEKARLHLDDPDASILDRSYMRYALGKAAEDLGEYEESMRNYEEATRLAAEAWFAHRPPDRTQYSRIIQATIESFPASMLKAPERQPIDSEKPLLVVGMIRSGTTLVEQILSSHPEIKGAGELHYWHDHAGKIFNVEARQIDTFGLAKLAEGYLKILDELGPGYARVIDKLPHNYTMLGFVLAAISGARVIYVKRSAVDNCLSIFTTAYQHPPAFTLSRSDIIFSYREHERIMAHWKSVAPSGRLLEVEYEDLVNHREPVTRRMVEFAGLPWDDACLHHERNPRNVNTPSVWQVRQPIYKTSVERWRKFEPWLREFRALLPDRS
jgi:tetratricopeptide (TPR) repeat protein